jgi:chemotaxis protein histidine kinase CheA
LDTTSQQRLLGYFIEEAKEHLSTLEQGILDLSSVMDDQERVNEMFRAAHSVKGGAAMLGYGSIQKVSHRLEDAFKILKEQKVPIDQKLESLFLRGYDVLQDLVERLEGSMSLPEEEAQEIMRAAEPSFVELQDYLQQLVGGKAKVSVTEGSRVTTSKITEQVKDVLKEMLQIFKQKDTPEYRQQLRQSCDKLAKLAPNETGWLKLLKEANNALANPKHPYRTLAPVIIKELKDAGDYLEMGKGSQIAPSSSLQQLAATSLPQILITLEPQSAANALLKAFNKQQLSQLIQLLKSGS